MPRHSITIVVAAILIEDEKICLVQEAKSSFYEKWYLPSGRVEHGENISDALIREVKEEAGLDIQPAQILSVEHAPDSRWMRFTWSATIVGGTLKTIPDSESLCAQWWPIEAVLAKEVPLRSNGILKLIQLARQSVIREADRLPVSKGAVFLNNDADKTVTPATSSCTEDVCLRETMMTS